MNIAGATADELHHAGDNHVGQRIDVRCGGEQHGGNSDQRSRDADGESLPRSAPSITTHPRIRP